MVDLQSHMQIEVGTIEVYKEFLMCALEFSMKLEARTTLYTIIVVTQ